MAMIYRLFIVACLSFFSLSCWAGPSSLFDIYVQALEKDPRVRISRQEVNIAKAQYDQSTAAMLPQATLYANFSDNEVDYEENTVFQTDAEYDGEKYSFVIRQTLFNWQTLSKTGKMSELVSQRESELLDVLNSLFVDVAKRYFEVLSAQDDLWLTRAEKTLVEEQLQQVEKMFSKKLVHITDLYETQARVDSVRTDEIDADNILAIKREALAELTGEVIGELFVFREGISLPELFDPIEFWVERALDNNAQLQSMHDNVKVATQNIAEQKGGHMPKVDLVFSDQISDVGFDNQQSPKRKTKYIGIDVTIPLFAGGGTSARVREAYAKKYIAQEKLEAVRREVLRETRKAYLNTHASLKRIKAADLGVKSAKKSYDAMKKSFSYGTVTAIDVLEALHKKTGARRDFQMARYQFVSHHLTLKKETGAITKDDLLEVNSWLKEPAAE